MHTKPEREADAIILLICVNIVSMILKRTFSGSVTAQDFIIIE